MKKTFSVLTTLAVIVGLMYPLFKSDTQAQIFPDVDGHSLETYIMDLYQSGIISGYSDGSFKPDEFVTRAQLAKFIVKAFNFEVDTSGVPFPDISDMSNELAQYVQTLKNLGIVGGFSDGTFKPDNFVTRSEITKFIYGALEKIGAQMEDIRLPENFTDVDENNKFVRYITYLYNVYSLGERIIKGFDDGSFHPEDYLTRAQLAKIIDLAKNVDIEMLNLKMSCIGEGGNWIDFGEQCNEITQETCTSLGGTFDECGSPCGRGYLESCATVCVPTCYFDTGKVCCESFGYGSLMEKCCESYEWTELFECITPFDFVGGGKQIVADSYCQQ